MKNNKINICHPAHSVLLSKKTRSREVVKKARKATTAHLFKGGCRVATEGIKFCSFCPSVLSFPGVVFFRQNDRTDIKLTRGNIDKRKNLYLCAFVKNKDSRTEEHKANAMKNNKINICHSAHSVLLSKKTRSREVVKKARKATTAHLFKGGCRVATEGIKFCSLCLSV